MPSRPSWEERNPRATPVEYAEVLRLARRISELEIARGASAVVLAGSGARRAARRNSDVDLWVVGRTGDNEFRVDEQHVVSIARRTDPELRSELRSPRKVGTVVPAWRTARILADRRGAARRLQREAARFRWGRIRPRCDRYVARSMTEWAEEAVKPTRLMADGHRESAAVQRNVLVNAMAGLLAIDRRLLYDENELWEKVGEHMGPSWHRHQARALGLGGESLEESCRAALELYCLTADALAPRLSETQRQVTDRVRAMTA